MSVVTELVGSGPATRAGAGYVTAGSGAGEGVRPESVRTGLGVGSATSSGAGVVVGRAVGSVAGAGGVVGRTVGSVAGAGGVAGRTVGSVAGAVGRRGVAGTVVSGVGSPVDAGAGTVTQDVPPGVRPAATVASTVAEAGGAESVGAGTTAGRVVVPATVPSAVGVGAGASSALAAVAERASQTSPAAPPRMTRRSGWRERNGTDAGSTRTPHFPDRSTVPYRVSPRAGASPEPKVTLGGFRRGKISITARHSDS